MTVENGDLRQLSDSELMRLVREGDFRAFDELYERHSGRVRRFLFHLTWDQDATEDYVQEVFLRLFRARDRWVAQADLSAYLFRIARNCYRACPSHSG